MMEEYHPFDMTKLRQHTPELYRGTSKNETKGKP